jgi:deoxyribodipyrimidine photo-lyase
MKHLAKQMPFIPTRAAALERLENFVPLAAKYAGRRNFDLGTGNHSAVSRLSPYIRTRLITEEEVTRAVLRRHSPTAAEKFLQEVAWRTYWKGWMEMHPGVWDDYVSSLSSLKNSAAYDFAIGGKTGIECFDHWTHELIETGYLHNHARMWYASIWIFTLKLPWQLGADFFLTHLLDADAAANTLSWRWVAGLHTPGKHYLARAENISKYTLGRFDPSGQINESSAAISVDESHEKIPLHLPANIRATGRVGHLMFPDDLAPAPGHVGNIVATAAYLPSVLETTSLVSNFLNGAVNDVLLENQGTFLTGDLSSALRDWITSEKLDSIVVSLPTVGPTKDFLSTCDLPAEMITFVRSWDRLLWPHASAGFFKLKKALPKLHSSLTPLREFDLFPHV